MGWFAVRLELERQRQNSARIQRKHPAERSLQAVIDASWFDVALEVHKQRTSSWCFNNTVPSARRRSETEAHRNHVSSLFQFPMDFAYQKSQDQHWDSEGTTT